MGVQVVQLCWVDASLPQGPGLGVEIDEKKVMEIHPKKPTKPTGWPRPRHEKDGGIADY